MQIILTNNTTMKNHSYCHKLGHNFSEYLVFIGMSYSAKHIWASYFTLVYTAFILAELITY